jgi:hypothetical protein
MPTPTNIQNDFPKRTSEGALMRVAEFLADEVREGQAKNRWEFGTHQT